MDIFNLIYNCVECVFKMAENYILRKGLPEVRFLLLQCIMCGYFSNNTHSLAYPNGDREPTKHVRSKKYNIGISIQSMQC